MPYRDPKKIYAKNKAYRLARSADPARREEFNNKEKLRKRRARAAYLAVSPPMGREYHRQESDGHVARLVELAFAKPRQIILTPGQKYGTP